MSIINKKIQYIVEDEVVLTGIAEYITPDGWVGVRQEDGRLDEVFGWYVRTYE